jgi:hypothetical protein
MGIVLRLVVPLEASLGLFCETVSAWALLGRMPPCAVLGRPAFSGRTVLTVGMRVRALRAVWAARLGRPGDAF